MEIILIAFVFATWLIARPMYQYTKSGYGRASGNSMLKSIFNRGNYGEFLTYYYIEKLPGNKKLIPNLYIPKEDGTTTEIDLVMIDVTGIYVFESKNYSGWIFGDEKRKMWTQSLRGGKKFSFYNPIWQNKGHIDALKKHLNAIDKDIYKSYIVFSERCRLKKINLVSQDIKVINRNLLAKIINRELASAEVVLSQMQVDEIYHELLQYTLVDDHVKEQHVRNLESKRRGRAL